MTRQPARTTGVRTSDSRAPSDWLELAMLAVLLALIPLRTVLHETQTQDAPSITRHLDAPAGPSPATALIFDGIIFAAAVTVAANRAWRGGPRFAGTGAEFGAALMLVAAVISCAAAAQTRVALTGAIDLIAIIVYGILLRQLLLRPAHLRLALCVLLATAALVTYKCVVQVWWEFPETQHQYYEQLRQQMNLPDDAQQRGLRHDYEQRLKGQAASAFFAHPNVAGTCLASFALLAFGVAMARRKRSGLASCVLPIVVALSAGAATILTQSKGAAAALASGLLLWCIWLALRKKLTARPRAALMIFWLTIATALGGTITYGIAKNGLPTRSMLYRWQYWRGAVGMASKVGWHGVGVNNFGEYFTRYKPVECPEEVQDPHSWIVRTAVEWGPLGLLAFITILVGVSIRLATPRPPERVCEKPFQSRDREGAGGFPREKALTMARSPLPHGRGSEIQSASQTPSESPHPLHAPPGPSMLRWFFTISTIVATGYVFAYYDAWEKPAHAAFILQTLVEILIVWAVSFALASAESREVSTISDEPLGDLRPGLAIAALIFLLHASVDIALSTSSATMLLFAILAVALATTATNHEPPKTPQPNRAKMIAIVGLLLLGIYAWNVVRPVALAAAALDQARRAPAGTSWEDFNRSGALAAYERAIQADPRDSAAVDELLDELVREPARVPTIAVADQALAWTATLRHRDRATSHADAFAARLYAMRHALAGDPADLRRAAGALERCVDAYPTSPERRLSHGQLLAQWAAEERSTPIAKAAADQLRTALALDKQRIYISQPHHFTDEQVTAIQAEIARLDAATPADFGPR